MSKATKTVKLIAGTIVGRSVGWCDMCGHPKQNLLHHINYWTDQRKHRDKVYAYCLICYRNVFSKSTAQVAWADFTNRTANA
jgi:L,D-peptidoglycan transpeptidase YkuD (ErfK/YbiS/YcfS/YnhG family)